MSNRASDEISVDEFASDMHNDITIFRLSVYRDANVKGEGDVKRSEDEWLEMFLEFKKGDPATREE